MSDKFPAVGPSKLYRKYLAMVFGADQSGDPATIPNRFDADRYRARLAFDQRNEAIALETCCRKLGSLSGRWQDLPTAMHRRVVKAEWAAMEQESDDEFRRELMYPTLIEATMDDFLHPFGKKKDDGDE